MKCFFRKAVLIIMAVAASVNFTSCIRNLDMSNSEEIASLLKEKYKEEFVVDSIGNRLASDRADTVTAFCHPQNDPNVIFEAVMDVERTLVSDNYPVRILEVQAKNEIETDFRSAGVKASVSVSISKAGAFEKNAYADPAQLISSNPTLSFTFTTIVCDGADPQKTYDSVVSVLNRYYSGDPEMLLGTTIWKYDESSYEKCLEEMNSIPKIGKTALEQYGPLSKVNVSINKGTLNTDFDSFSKNF